VASYRSRVFCRTQQRGIDLHVVGAGFIDLTLPPVDRLEDRSVRRDVLFLEPGVAASFPYDLNGAMDRN